MWQIFRELKSSVGTTQRIGETLRQHGSGGAFLGSGVQRQKGTRSASESAATLTRASPPPPAPSTSCFSPRGLKSPAPPPSPSTSLPRGAVRLFHSFVFQTLHLLFYVEQKFRLLTSCLSVSTFVWPFVLFMAYPRNPVPRQSQRHSCLDFLRTRAFVFHTELFNPSFS